MQSDLPRTQYKFDNTDNDPKKHTVASDEVMRLQEEANQRMKERKAAKQEGEPSYELEELFN